MSCRIRTQRGIALVLVLWVIVLLSVIAGSMSMTQRTGVAVTSNLRQERQGRALVNAGLQFMMLQLDNRNKPREENPWPVDGQLHPWFFAGATVWVGAKPENARIDLNQADEKMLQKLLESLGLEEEQTLAVRDAILDWRDSDDGRRALGAEDNEYQRDGRPIGARDAHFLSVEELQQVRGVTPQLYKKLAAVLTVDARQSTVDPVFASRTVLLAVPGMTPELVDQYVADRQQALAEGLPAPPPPAGGNYFSTGKSASFRVFAEVDTAVDIQVRGDAVINIQSRTPKGYRILRKGFGGANSLARAPLPEEAA